jgi:hypothetical protein
MAKLSKEQKEFILKQLNSFFQSVYLMCDGHEVSLKLERVQNFKLAVGVYVDGWMKGVWLLRPEEHPESKFFPNKAKSIYSPKRKQEIIKAFGKRRAYKEFPNLDGKIESKGTHFSTPQAALNHLIKVSESIELLTEMAA